MYAVGMYEINDKNFNPDRQMNINIYIDYFNKKVTFPQRQFRDGTACASRSVRRHGGLFVVVVRAGQR